MIANIPQPIIRAAAALFRAGYRSHEQERILADIPSAKAHMMDYCRLLSVFEALERVR